MSEKILLKNIGEVYTMTEQGVLRNYSVLVENGKISKITEKIDVGNDIEVIDCTGLKLFPGFIDAYTHIGVYPLEWEYGEHGVEKSDVVAPHLRVIDGLDLYDKAFEDAVRGGVTTIASYPGSYLSFGKITEYMTIVPGQSAVIKTNRRIIVETHGIVFALGEHVKRYLREQKLSPTTRMGIIASIRTLFQNALDYREKRKENQEELPRDLKLEAILDLLEGRLTAFVHAHTGNDIRTLVKLLREYNVNNIVVLHGTEAHFIADFLREENIPVIYGPIIFSKRGVELRNLDSRTPVRLYESNVRFALTTNHPTIPIQYLPLIAGVSVGEGLPRLKAYEAITIEPARILGLDDRIGSIAPGKDADLVVFDGDPLEPDSKLIYALIDGVKVFER